jgi:hypothetical protein
MEYTDLNWKKASGYFHIRERGLAASLLGIGIGIGIVSHLVIAEIFITSFSM